MKMPCGENILHRAFVVEALHLRHRNDLSHAPNYTSVYVATKEGRGKMFGR